MFVRMWACMCAYNVGRFCHSASQFTVHNSLQFLLVPISHAVCTHTAHTGTAQSCTHTHTHTHGPIGHAVYKQTHTGIHMAHTGTQSTHPCTQSTHRVMHTVNTHGPIGRTIYTHTHAQTRHSHAHTHIDNWPRTGTHGPINPNPSCKLRTQRFSSQRVWPHTQPYTGTQIHAQYSHNRPGKVRTHAHANCHGLQ